MTYEYLCQACGHEWEAEQTISEAPLKQCPKCGEARAKRQVSGGAGFILKGGGWYADGYGTKKPAASEDKAAGKESAKDGSSKEASSKEGSGKKEGSSTSESKAGGASAKDAGASSSKASGNDKGGSGSGKESAA